MSIGNNHFVDVAFTKRSHRETENGLELTMIVRAACREFCNLTGATIKILDMDGEELGELPLVRFNGVENETEEFTIEVIDPGDYTWKAVFTGFETSRGKPHGEADFSFSFNYVPHSISMAVWDIPLTAIEGEPFTVKLGARCSANCSLAGNRITVVDTDDNELGSGVLNTDLWRDTQGLYWTEIELIAPSESGVYTPRALYQSINDTRETSSDEAQATQSDTAIDAPVTNDAPIHHATNTSFTFRVTPAPDSIVTIEVVDKETQTPIINQPVMLHPYHAKSDEAGKVRFEVPGSEYKLYVSGQSDFVNHKSVQHIKGEIELRIELDHKQVLEGDF